MRFIQSFILIIFGINKKRPMAQGTIKFEEFQKADLRVGRVLSVKDMHGADKLYLLEVDIGRKIQLVAGIKMHYTPHELEGKKIIVVANLEPAKIRGFESQGMLLAAEHDGRIVLLAPDRDIEPGSRIK